MQIFPVKMQITKPASEFHNGICSSWSLGLHVNTFTAFACPVCQGELCLLSFYHFLLFCVWLSERGKTLVQKKPTMYPEWKSTFDAHIYEGRVIQIVLMKAAEEPLSEVTVGVSVLAERCKKGNGKAEFWVSEKFNFLTLPTWLCFFQTEQRTYAYECSISLACVAGVCKAINLAMYNQSSRN